MIGAEGTFYITVTSDRNMENPKVTFETICLVYKKCLVKILKNILV